MVKPPESHQGLSLVLQNGMASPFELALALLDEFYLPVYRVATALLGEAQSQACTERAFVLAMLDAKNYRESSDLPLWFFKNALEALKVRGLWIAGGSYKPVSDPVLGRIAAPARLPILLHYLAGLTVSQIAALLGADTDMIVMWLPRQALLPPENARSGSDSDARSFVRPNLTSDELLFEKTLLTNWPAPDASPERLEALAGEIAQKAGDEGERMSQSGRKRQALAVAMVFLAVLLVLLITSPIKADQNQGVVRVTVITQIVTRLVTVTGPARRMNGPYTVSDSLLDGTVEPTSVSTATPEPTGRLTARQDLTGQNRGLQFVRMPTPRTLFALSQRNLPGFSGPSPSGKLPLAENSSANEIAQAIRTSDTRITTLAADIWARFYASSGYSGPDRQYRYQVWASQDQVLVLGGSPGGSPSETWMGDAAHLELFTTTNPPIEVSPPDWGPAYLLKRPLIGGLDLLFNPNLWENTPGEADNQNLKVVGIQQQAGRQALVVEKLSLFGQVDARLWIDTQTGLVLRNQQFESDGNTIEMDIQVNSITYDVPFTNPIPFDLQYPWVAHFASDFAGGPASVQTPVIAPIATEQPFIADRKAPPPGFNPSRSRLTFRYPADFDLKSGDVMVSLYGDTYYLGDVWLGNPWTTVCTRSPDGSKLAFTSRPVLNSSYQPVIYWYDLSKLPLQRDGMLKINAQEMAFAPDNRRLAVAGTESDPASSGVFMADLQTNTARLLSPISGSSLVWRLDGQLLALISLRFRFTPEALALNPDSGEIVNRSPLNAPALINGTDDWKVYFPPAPGHLDACVNP